jgi:hypothetical protein
MACFVQPLNTIEGGVRLKMGSIAKKTGQNAGLAGIKKFLFVFCLGFAVLGQVTSVDAHNEVTSGEEASSETPKAKTIKHRPYRSKKRLARHSRRKRRLGRQHGRHSHKKTNSSRRPAGSSPPRSRPQAQVGANRRPALDPVMKRTPAMNPLPPPPGALPSCPVSKVPMMNGETDLEQLVSKMSCSSDAKLGLRFREKNTLGFFLSQPR